MTVSEHAIPAQRRGPRVWLVAGLAATEPAEPDEAAVVRDDQMRRWQHGTDGRWHTPDGRHHATWRELHGRFDLRGGDGMTASKHAEVIELAVERLRYAAQAAHHVPVRLEPIADWLDLAAQVHAGEIPCDWCATGDCPAVDAACALLGDPPPHLIAQYRRRFGTKRSQP